MSIFTKQTGEDEYRAYRLFAAAGVPVPHVLSYESGILSLENCGESHTAGWAQLERMIDMAADLHAFFWDNYDAFGQVGLPWRLDSPKNFARHCGAMKKSIKPYCKAHGMDTDVFRRALDYFRAQMPERMETRFHAGKNITVLHGDLHPGNVLLPKTDGGRALFIDLEAVRMGLGAEDLVMLLALHTAPEKEKALPLLERYHRRLCESVSGYAFEALLADYRIFLAEGLFFPVKLWINGTDGRDMMARALQAWQEFQ